MSGCWSSAGRLFHSPHWCLLDLSAAFDTVDHDILIRRLRTSYGLSGMVLQWFQSYLAGTCMVCWNRTVSSASSPTLIVCGVPHESVLDPLPAAHCRPCSTDPESRSLPTLVRRRRTNLRILSAVCVHVLYNRSFIADGSFGFALRKYGFFYHFVPQCSCDLDLYPMTFIYELD